MTMLRFLTGSRLLAVATATVAIAPAFAFAGQDTPLPRRANHVVIISIDGLRPDAIEKFGASTLQQLMREGRYSLTAQTILPSKTLPSHTSMLTGVDADKHGVTWNSEELDEHGHVDVPTIFGLAKERGLTTAAFFSKTKFHHLEVPKSLDYVRSPKGGLLTGRFSAERTTQFVEDYLESDAAAPDLMFVHIGEPDYAGHVYGWMSMIYGQAVRQADKAVAEIIDEANDRFGGGNWTLIVTADHGGHGRDHGSEDPRDTTIPWIIWGQGITPGDGNLDGIRTMDTAATALWMLGIDTPSDWIGRPVAGAFTTTSSVLATSR